jgi:hypothetical protein
MREPPVEQPPMLFEESERDILNDMFDCAWEDMVRWRPRWATIAAAMLPDRAAWCESDTPQTEGAGPPSYSTMLDSTPTLAARVLAAGLSGQLTNSTEVWFALTTTDPRTDSDVTNARWLAHVGDVILAAMDRSNFYSQSEQAYLDAGVFSTTGMSIDPDQKTDVRCMVHAIGSYAIGQDLRGRVNLFARQWQATGPQLLKEFSLKNLPPVVVMALQARRRKQQFTVRHMIYPNEQHAPEHAQMDSTKMEFTECYWVHADKQDGEFKPLSRGYYAEFPVPCFRWGPVQAGKVWGSFSPGFVSLPDVLMLYETRLQYLNALQLGIDPTYTAGRAFRNKKVARRRGQVNVDDEAQGDSSLKVLNQPTIPYQHVSAEMQLIRGQIQEAFYVPIMLPMLLRMTSQNEQPTATQAGFARDEQFGMLGPVVERFSDEWADMVIDRFFGILWRAGKIDPPPDSLRKKPLRVVLKSQMARAQQAVGVAALERHLQFTGACASVWGPNALDGTDMDKLQSKHAEKIGLDPEVRRTIPERDAIRMQRVKAQQATASSEAMVAASTAAKNLSAARPAPDNALGQVQAALQNQTAGAPAPN